MNKLPHQREENTMKIHIAYCCLVALLTLISCDSRESGHSEKRSSEFHKPNPNSLANFIGKTVPVNIYGQSFLIESRLDKIKQFPCSSCHEDSKIDENLEDSQFRRAHWGITATDLNKNHAPETQMSCFSCHDKTDPSNLALENGTFVGLDNSYQTCAKCHSGQVKDWANGAHGKRLSGWDAIRVVRNCTGCHNPHNPRLESRWPSISAGTQGVRK